MGKEANGTDGDEMKSLLRKSMQIHLEGLSLITNFILSVMLSEQEETIKKYKTRLRELGENIVSDEEGEDDDDDLT